MEKELYHFTEEGVKCHCQYEDLRVEGSKYGVFRFKVPVSKIPCDCSKRGAQKEVA